MIKNKICLMVIIGMAIFSTQTFVNTTNADAASRLGVGVNYWVALKNIDINDVDEKGYSLLFSYQHIGAGFFKFEADLGLLQEGYAGAQSSVWSPQAYFLIGKGLYGGVGIGINYSDGDWAEKPFYALRAGVDLEVLPSIFLDINANYRFENWNFDNIDTDIRTDTVTLGAVVRLQF